MIWDEFMEENDEIYGLFPNEFQVFNIQNIFNVYDELKKVFNGKYHFGLRLPYPKSAFCYEQVIDKYRVKKVLFCEENNTSLLCHTINDEKGEEARRENENPKNTMLLSMKLRMDRNMTDWVYPPIENTEKPRYCSIQLPLDDNFGFVGGLDKIVISQTEGGQLSQLADKVQSFYNSEKWLIFTVLLLLNCKNIERVEVNPSIRIKRKNSKVKNKLRNFYTIKIPHSLYPRKGENIEQYHQRMHLERGHYKKYDENPLFGKFKGTYWWKPQMKGSRELGLIEKNYQVVY